MNKIEVYKFNRNGVNLEFSFEIAPDIREKKETFIQLMEEAAQTLKQELFIS